MNNFVFLFPGQGAQTPGMMQDVVDASAAAKKMLADLSAAAGEDIGALLWESDAATLARSDRSQIAITAASLLVVAALAEKGIAPVACAGFSLGEFPAMYAAGVLSFADVVALVKKRGEIMQGVCETIAARSPAGAAPGMSAVLGLGPDAVQAEIAKMPAGTELYAANLNSPRQTVVSGTAAGLTLAETAFKAAGAKRVVRLAVAGPYHSPLMQEAADKFAAVVAGVTFNDPAVPLFSNVTGARVATGAEVQKNIPRHLVEPVRWTDEEAAIAALLGKTYAADAGLLETGPGKVLTGLWKDTPFAEKWAAVPCGTAAQIGEI
jgi:[acyl-carrier-protein] S-malonyltransferase